MSDGQLAAAIAGLVAIAFNALACWIAYAWGRRSGRDERPVCGHPPCPLAGATARVTFEMPAPPDAARTHEVTADVVAAARAQASEEQRRASGSWAAASPSGPRWPADAHTLPDLTHVPDDLKRSSRPATPPPPPERKP